MNDDDKIDIKNQEISAFFQGFHSLGRGTRDDSIFGKMLSDYNEQAKILFNIEQTKKEKDDLLFIEINEKITKLKNEWAVTVGLPVDPNTEFIEGKVLDETLI